MNYYNIKMDGQSIYNPKYKEMSLLSLSVSIGAGEAGNFDFTFPRNHVFIDSIVPYGSTIEVFEDGESIFYGRPLPPTIDIFHQKKVHCEGALAFLNDVICPPNAPGLTVSMNDGQYYRFLINYYNSQQVRSDRKLTLGTVPTGGVSRVREWSYRSCMNELRSNVLPYTGGVLLTRRQNGKTYIDWKNEFTSTGNQPIMLGLNLLDVSRTGQQFYTMAIASGGQDSEGKTISMSAPVKVSADLCGKYGNICAYLSYPEITSVSALQTKCILFLQKQQFDGFSFQADAVDMHISNSAYEQLAVGKKANIKFSDLDNVLTMPITKVVVDISNGKKTVTVSSADWTEKKQYVKNDSQIKSLTELQADTANSVGDLDITMPELAEEDPYEIDPITGNKILEETTVDPETGEVTKTITIIPDELVLRKIEGEYSVGDTITGDLVRISPTGEKEEIDEYTILATDQVTVGHSNGVVDVYGPGDSFTFYYSDNLVIETQDGYTITYQTYEEDGAYEIDEVIDKDDFDAFLKYGDGTETKLDSDDWEIDVDDVTVTGTENDPQTVTATVTKTPDSTKITTLTINDDGVSSEVTTGSVDLDIPISGTISTGLDGQGTYITGLLLTPSYKEYDVGQTFNLSDFTANLAYNDGTIEDVTSECDFNMDDGYVFNGESDPRALAAVWYDEVNRMFTAITSININSRKITGVKYQWEEIFVDHPVFLSASEGRLGGYGGKYYKGRKVYDWFLDLWDEVPVPSNAYLESYGYYGPAVSTSFVSLHVYEKPENLSYVKFEPVSTSGYFMIHLYDENDNEIITRRTVYSKQPMDSSEVIITSTDNVRINERIPYDSTAAAISGYNGTCNLVAVSRANI